MEERFPRGWTEKRVARVLEDCEAQSEDEAVAEDEEAFPTGAVTVIKIPAKLLPKVRAMIAKAQLKR